MILLIIVLFSLPRAAKTKQLSIVSHIRSLLSAIIATFYYRCRGFDTSDLKKSFGRTAVAIGLYCFTPLTQVIFSFLTCTPIGNDSVITSEPGISCSTSQYVGWTVFSVFIIVFLVFLYILSAVLIYRGKNSQSDGMLMVLGIFHESYADRYWWEFVMTFFRTLLVIFWVSFFNSQNVQSLLFTVFVAVFLILHVLANPYLESSENYLELFSFATLLLASIMKMAPDTTDTSAIYIVLIVVASVVFLVHFLVVRRADIVAKLRGDADYGKAPR